MNWVNPENFRWLWLIPAFAAGLAWFGFMRRRALRLFCDPELSSEVSSSLDGGKRHWKRIFIVLAIFFMVLSLAGPQRPGKSVFVQRAGLDIVIAVDVSNSMLSEDILPNRLEKAKLELQDLVEKAEGDRIGVIAFAGDAYVQLPLTLDRSAAKIFIKTLSPNLVPVPGTDIGRAILAAQGMYVDESSEDKVLILLTDGENHESDPVRIAKEAAKRGIRIYAIGIGTQKGEVIPERGRDGRVQFKKDLYGNIVVTKLDEKTLREITKVTDGVFYRTRKGALEVDRIYSDIRHLTQKETGSGWVMEQEPLYQYFLALSVLFLMLEMFLSERRRTA